MKLKKWTPYHQNKLYSFYQIANEMWTVLFTQLVDIIQKCLLYRYWFIIYWRYTLGKSRLSWFSWKEFVTRKKRLWRRGIWYGLFLAPKTKCCSTINEFGVIGEHKTFKVFKKVSYNINWKEYFTWRLDVN